MEVTIPTLGSKILEVMMDLFLLGSTLPKALQIIRYLIDTGGTESTVVLLLLNQSGAYSTPCLFYFGA